jgi:two-component system response regulator HydG
MTPPRADPLVLVIDDHPEMARLLADQLGDAGYRVDVAHGGREALERARSRPYDLVITDLRMRSVDGFDVLDGVRAIDPAIPVLIMTAFGAIESAIEAVKRGAYHYLTKPFRLEEVLLHVERALDDRRLRDENRSLRRLAIERSGLGAMVGRSPSMRALYDLVERVAQSPAPVLIGAESGSGKELVARALHVHGARAAGPFVAVNCTALPEALLESELFGHVRGAFTGATTARRGLFVEADGGTLFLDEIGDMPAGLQSKLLRVLEDREVRAVGADVARKVDVRVIAATHQDLEHKVAAGAFRVDLFYRLNVIPIAIPPLRERLEDLPILVEHLLARARERNPGARATRLAPDVITAFARHTWPGNVRELENLIERLVVVSTHEEVGAAELAAHATIGASASGSPLAAAKERMLTLKQLEHDYIAWVIAQCGGNKTRAAEILGIDVSTIHRRERDRG